MTMFLIMASLNFGGFSGGSNPVKGDFLVLAGATLYAVSNTSEVSKCHNKNMLLYRAKM